MPPKRQRAATPSPNKKAKKQQQQQHRAHQPSIDSFFTSPSKSKANGTGRPKDDDVISIPDSDDDVISPIESKGANELEVEDEVLARKLAKEWGVEDDMARANGASHEVKGKCRAVTPKADEGGGRGDDIVEVEAPYSEAPGINGSSSSTHLLTSQSRAPTSSSSNRSKLVKSSTGETKPLTPLFSKSGPTTQTSSPPDNKPDIKAQTTPNKNKNNAITSTAAEPVDMIDFDTDAFLFRPDDFDISKWPKGRLPYAILVACYVQVSSTRSRLTIVRVLTNFLHLLLSRSPIDLPPSLYLLSNHLLPSYLPCELGVGSQILTKAIQEVSGCQPRDLKRLWEKWGDPGDVAFEAKSNLRTLVTPSPLLVGDVYTRLVGLSRIKGQHSGKVKGDVVRKLMVQARGEEMRFLVRSLIGNLRIGAVRLTLLNSLARATALLHAPPTLLSEVRPIPPPKAVPGQKRVLRPKVEPDPAREELEARCVEAVKIVRKVYVRHPNYGDLVRGLDAGGLDGLDERVPVSVGIPLSPMLGCITRSLNDVFTRLGSLPFTAEAKLDGQRVQIHARLNGPQGEADGGGRWVESSDGSKVWVRLFSRHLEDMTEKYPDICHLILTLLSRPLPPTADPFPSTASEPSASVLDLLKVQHVDSFIMDAEVVAVDKDTGAYRTFQDLSNRAKKDVKVEDIKVVVGVFAFDLMLVNDQPLLNAPFSHRRHVLRTLFPPVADPLDPTLARFAQVESLDSTSCIDTPAEMQAFFEMVVEQKCEGLMVKLLESGEGMTGDDAEDDDEGRGGGGGGGSGGKKKKGNGGKKKPLPATYEPDQRSEGWLKVKKDYLEGLGDSLDLVPIGAWWGQGRKAGWWSPILLACHNPETGALEAVCKCISGFTDQFYKDLIKRYPPKNALPEKCNTDNVLGYYDTNGLRPDVWFSPTEVWEIRGADVTLSPVYPAAATLLGNERGLSIRFPRFMKLRDDKTWEQATTSEQFADMYRRQMREAPVRTTAGGPVEVRRGSEEAEADMKAGDVEGSTVDGDEGDEEGNDEGECEEEDLDDQE